MSKIEPTTTIHNLVCAYCDKPAEGNYSIHRDHFDFGKRSKNNPEVPLCDSCGSDETPTCEAIWARIKEKRLAANCN